MDTMTLWKPLDAMPEDVLARVMALPECPWRHDLLLGWSYAASPAAFVARLGELEVLAAEGYGAGGMGIPPAVLDRAIAIPTTYWAGMLAVAYQVNRSDFDWALVTAEVHIGRSGRREGLRSPLGQRLRLRLAAVLRRALRRLDPSVDSGDASTN